MLLWVVFSEVLGDCGYVRDVNFAVGHAYYYVRALSASKNHELGTQKQELKPQHAQPQPKGSQKTPATRADKTFSHTQQSIYRKSNNRRRTR
jgi:hypothetical protein